MHETGSVEPRCRGTIANLPPNPAGGHGARTTPADHHPSFLFLIVLIYHVRGRMSRGLRHDLPPPQQGECNIMRLDPSGRRKAGWVPSTPLSMTAIFTGSMPRISSRLAHVTPLLAYRPKFRTNPRME